MQYDGVIRCKNEIDWLPRVLKSIRMQSITPNEVFLVDDKSNDGSVQHAQEQGCSIIHYDKEDFNYSYALNLGLRQTTSEYVLILSAHCELAKNESLELMLRLFNKHLNLAGVFGRQIPTKNSNPFDTRDLLTVFGREQVIYSSYPFFHNAFSLISKKSWSEISFDEGYNGIEDRVWAKEQTKAGNIVIYEPEAVVFHEHGLNQGTSFGRAERVCNALKNLHQDDMFEWPSFKTNKD